jgi:hypothetical protein
MKTEVIIILQGCRIPPLGREPFDFLDIPYVLKRVYELNQIPLPYPPIRVILINSVGWDGMVK